LVIFINLFFISAIFLGATFVSKTQPSWFGRFGLDSEILRPLLWLVAMVVSLPFLIASYKKLHALGMIIADIKVRRDMPNDRRAVIQSIVSHTILISGLLLVALLLLILSSSILRNGKSLWLLLLIVAAITVLLWRTFTRVYSKAQFAVQEAFVGAPSESKATHPLPGILKEAEMETIVLAP